MKEDHSPVFMCSPEVGKAGKIDEVAEVTTGIL
jgi:hypothetical protein